MQSVADTSQLSSASYRDHLLISDHWFARVHKLLNPKVSKSPSIIVKSLMRLTAGFNTQNLCIWTKKYIYACIIFSQLTVIIPLSNLNIMGLLTMSSVRNKQDI
jgi:hypothetical protein